MTRSQTWWDVGTLSSNRSVRLTEHNNGAKSNVFRRRNKEDISSSVPDLADDQGEDRSSLFGSISRAILAKSRARRNSDADVSVPSSLIDGSSDHPTPSVIPTPVPQVRPRDSPSEEIKVLSDGRGTTRRGNLFKWLKEGVGSRINEQPVPTVGRKSDANNVVSVPRYTRINDEINQMTSEFRRSTVEYPLP